MRIDGAFNIENSVLCEIEYVPDESVTTTFAEYVPAANWLCGVKE